MNKLQYHCSNSAPYSVSIHVLNADLFLHSQQKKMADPKSFESQFRFIWPHFGSINSNSAQR